MASSKQCDSCKSCPATLFCRADSAFLCSSCDSLIHSANKLASRHPRFFLCDVCEHSPATVSCKADAAHLCSSCDLDIHSANPLSRRHDRLPLSPFFNDPTTHLPPPDDTNDAANDDAAHDTPPTAATAAAISKLFGDDYYSDSDDAEAASWLLSNTKHAEDEPKSIDYLFGDTHPHTHTHVGSFMDLVDPPKPDPGVDCLVPDPDPDPDPNNPEPHSMYSLSSYNHNFNNNNNNNNDLNAYESHHHHHHHHHPHLKHHYHPVSSFAPANQPSLSHSVSSSSLEFGVVPDANAMADVGSKQQIKMMGLDREARVLRYREKRKNRKFEKTIRYASRKAYAETRPRIKGRFAKRTDVDPAASVDALFASDPGYGVVPSF